MIAIVSILSLLMGEAITTLSRTHSYNRGQVRITDVSDAVAQVISRDVGVSVRVFAADASGDSYAAALDFGTLSPIPGSRRPIFTDLGYLEPDAPGGVNTGNVLLLGIREDPLTVTITLPGAPAPSPYRIDVLRFVSYFPTAVSQSSTFDLVRWCSERVARLSDVMAVTDSTARQYVIKDLALQGIRYAWEPTFDRARGLYKLSTAGGATLLSASEKISGDAAATRHSLAGIRRVWLCPNGLVPQAQMPLYANAPTDPGLRFPGGLEIRVDGPTSGRLVLVRLVLVSMTEQGAYNHAEVRRLLSCHDG